MAISKQKRNEYSTLNVALLIVLFILGILGFIGGFFCTTEDIPRSILFGLGTGFISSTAVSGVFTILNIHKERLNVIYYPTDAIEKLAKEIYLELMKYLESIISDKLIDDSLKSFNEWIDKEYNLNHDSNAVVQRIDLLTKFNKIYDLYFSAIKLIDNAKDMFGFEEGDVRLGLLNLDNIKYKSSKELRTDIKHIIFFLNQIETLVFCVGENKKISKCKGGELDYLFYDIRKSQVEVRE